MQQPRDLRTGPRHPWGIRIAYDLDLLQQVVGSPETRGDIVILRVDDVSGDGLRDNAFQEDRCVDGNCKAVSYMLSIERDPQRRVGVESVLDAN